MRNSLAILFMLIMITFSACLPMELTPSVEMPDTVGQGIINTPQTQTNLLPTETTQVEPQSVIQTSALALEVVWQTAGLPDQYWVTNPGSGARLFTQVVHPEDWDGSALPALVLIPG